MKRVLLLSVLAALVASGAHAQIQSQELLADANRDGKITPKEYQDSRRTYLMRADNNRDGKIDAAEWKRAAASERLDLRQKGVDNADLVGKGGWFQAMDLDKDNTLTPTEINTYTAARFASLDPNGDGVITRNEVSEIEKAANKSLKSMK